MKRLRQIVKIILVLFLINALLHKVNYAQEASVNNKIFQLCKKSISFSDTNKNKALTYAEKALSFAKTTNDTCLFAEPYYAKAVAYQKNSEPIKSADYYIRAYNYSEKCDNVKTAIKQANNLGVLYRSIKQNEKAKEFIEYRECL